MWGEIRALVVDEREQRSGGSEDAKEADEGRCDGCNGAMECPEKDEESGEEERERELEEDGNGVYDVLYVPSPEVVQAVLAHLRNGTSVAGDTAVVLVQPLLDHDAYGGGGQAENETGEPQHIQPDSPTRDRGRRVRTRAIGA